MQQGGRAKVWRGSFGLLVGAVTVINQIVGFGGKDCAIIDGFAVVNDIAVRAQIVIREVLLQPFNSGCFAFRVFRFVGRVCECFIPELVRAGWFKLRHVKAINACASCERQKGADQGCTSGDAMHGSFLILSFVVLGDDQINGLDGILRNAELVARIILRKADFLAVGGNQSFNKCFKFLG